MTYMEINSSNGFNFRALASLIANRLIKDALKKEKNARKEQTRNYRVQRFLRIIAVLLVIFVLTILGTIAYSGPQACFILWTDYVFKAEEWYYQILLPLLGCGTFAIIYGSFVWTVMKLDQMKFEFSQ